MRDLLERTLHQIAEALLHPTAKHNYASRRALTPASRSAEENEDWKCFRQSTMMLFCEMIESMTSWCLLSPLLFSSLSSARRYA
jgi:hypothetical protein